jgi:hypothetical protein
VPGFADLDAAVRVELVEVVTGDLGVAEAEPLDLGDRLSLIGVAMQ